MFIIVQWVYYHKYIVLFLSIKFLLPIKIKIIQKKRHEVIHSFNKYYYLSKKKNSNFINGREKLSRVIRTSTIYYIFRPNINLNSILMNPKKKGGRGETSKDTNTIWLENQFLSKYIALLDSTWRASFHKRVPMQFSKFLPWNSRPKMEAVNILGFKTTDCKIWNMFSNNST